MHTTVESVLAPSRGGFAFEAPQLKSLLCPATGDDGSNVGTSGRYGVESESRDESNKDEKQNKIHTVPCSCI